MSELLVSSQSLLHFMHITKTAGGSLIQTLLTAPSLRDKVLHTNTLEDNDDFLDYSVIFGHFGYGVHKITKQEPNYACFFRNPVSRTISHYYQLSKFDDSIIGERIRAIGGDINFYFQSEYKKNTIYGEFSNQMVNMLLGTSEIANPENDLYTAKQRLHELKYIGIQEYYDISIVKLAHYLGIDISELTSATQKKENATYWKLEDIEDETIRIIQEINTLDLIIYQDAINRFFDPISNVSLSGESITELSTKLDANICSPNNVALLSHFSYEEREKFAYETGTLVLYLGDEVTAVKKAEENAVLCACPKGFLPEKLNGLNIGAGNRTISPYLTPIDIMRAASSVDGEHHAFTSGSLLSLPDNLPFKNESIDYIVALHMLEHVENPVEVIQHWLNIIKPGGGLGIIVPDWRYTWDARNDNHALGHKWNPTPLLIVQMYEQYWSKLAKLESLNTYDFKISFDFVLRKEGEFIPFLIPKIDDILSGAKRHEKNIFLHGS
jgi:SAM-dependent methyltransferase